MDRFYLSTSTSSRRSRSSEKPSKWTALDRKIMVPDLKPIGIGDFLHLETERACGEGVNQIRKRITAPKIALDTTCGNKSSTEENSFTLKVRRNSSKKATGMPVKMIGDEMSKEMKGKNSSPCIIARLMGLDAVPTQKPVCNQEEIAYLVKKKSLVAYQEKRVSNEDNICQMRTQEQQEFKDVFEVLETSELQKHKLWQARKTMQNIKHNDKEMTFIRQKFMDAKRLSTDEKLRNSKEFCDALEVLDSNKDLFLKFLREPNSLFTKHFHDLRSVSASPKASHITILKCSDGIRNRKSELFWKSERKAERRTQMRRDVKNSSKYETGLTSHFVREQAPLSRKLSNIKRDSESVHLPTRIVVLKPHLEKVQSMPRASSLPSSPESFYSVCRLRESQRRESQRCASQELFTEARERKKLFNEGDVLKHSIKGSREIAREITKHLRHTVSNNSIKMHASGHEALAQCSTISRKATLVDNETLTQNSGHYSDWSDCYSPSSSYSTDFSVNREARKRLSERWMRTHRLQEVRHSGRCSSTLGEMLALSDRETPKLTVDSLTGKKSPNDKLTGQEMHVRLGCPSGISSGDGLKDVEYSGNLPRSRSLQTLSTVHGKEKTSGRHVLSGNNNCFMLKDVLNLSSSKSSEGNQNQMLSSSHRTMTLGRNKSQRLNSMEDEDNQPVRKMYFNQEEMQDSVHERQSFQEGTSLSESSPGSISDSRDFVDCITVSDCEDPEMLSKTQEELLTQPTSSIVPGEDVYTAIICQNQIIEKETSTDDPEVESFPLHCDSTEVQSPVSSGEAENPSPISVLEPPDDDISSPECFERVSASLQGLRMQLRLLKSDSIEGNCAEESGVTLSDEDADGGEGEALQQKGKTVAFRNEGNRDFVYLDTRWLDLGNDIDDIGREMENMLFDSLLEQEVSEFIFQ